METNKKGSASGAVTSTSIEMSHTIDANPRDDGEEDIGPTFCHPYCSTYRELFLYWRGCAGRRGAWFKDTDLALMYRFALRRPRLSERRLFEFFQDVGVPYSFDPGPVKQPYRAPQGRERELLMGIDVDPHSIHVSTELKQVLRKLPPENLEQLQISSGLKIEAIQGHRPAANHDSEIDAEANMLRKRLWDVYEDVQEGSIPLYDAPEYYRTIRTEEIPERHLDTINERIDDDELAEFLRSWGILDCHVPTVDRQAQIGIVASPYSNDGQDIGIEERKIVRKIAALIRLYRSPEWQLGPEEFCMQVEQTLVGYHKKRPQVKEILGSQELNPLEAAEEIWEEIVLGDAPEPAPDLQPMLPPLSPGVSDTHQMNERMAHTREGPIEIMKSVESSSMGPPLFPASKTRKESKRPQPEWRGAVSGTAGNPSDELYREDRRSPSPDDGVTEDLFGIPMPSHQARDIARKINLPADYIQNRIRSKTHLRSFVKAHHKASTNVVFPRRKRKASLAVPSDSPTKMSRRNSDSDIFATQGESQRDFVLSHYQDTFLGKKEQSAAGKESAPITGNSVAQSYLAGKKTSMSMVKEPQRRTCVHVYLSHILGIDDIFTWLDRLETTLSPEDLPSTVRSVMDYAKVGIVTGAVNETCRRDGGLTSLLYFLVRKHSGEDDPRLADARPHLPPTPSLRQTVSIDNMMSRKQPSRPASPGVQAHRVLPPGQLTGQSGSDDVPSITNEEVMRLKRAFNVDEEDTFDPRNVPNALKPSSSISSPQAIDSGYGTMNPSPTVTGFLSGLSIANPGPSTANMPTSPFARLNLTSPGLPTDHDETVSRNLLPPFQQSAASPRPTQEDLPSAAFPQRNFAAGEPEQHQVGSHTSIASEAHSAAVPVIPCDEPERSHDPQDISKPPPSPRPPQEEWVPVPPPSPRPSHRKSVPVSPRSPSPPHKESDPVPPPSPRPSHRKSVPMFPPSPRPPHKELVPVSLPMQRSSRSRPAPLQLTPIQGTETQEYLARTAAFQQNTFLSDLQHARVTQASSGDEEDAADSKLADSKLKISRFFQTSNSGSTGASTSASALNKLFDKYRDNPAEDPDRIGVEGSMRYLGDIGVSLDEPVLLALLTELGAPTMGEFTREGFINGWSNMRADTISKQSSHIPSLRRSLPSNPAFFKKTYKQTFLLARAPGAKVLPLEAAEEYWRLLLHAPSYNWSTSSTPWLKWWIEYLEAKWCKSVSRDMWDQTGVFVMKSAEDESMSWWSEDGAWPGVIDEFVAYVRAKRVEDGKAGEAMDVA